MRFKKISPLIIALLTFFAWHKILNQTLLGESYMYFDRKAVGNLWGYDNFARFIFDIFQVTIKDNIKIYLALQLILMAALNVIFYNTVKFFSKNKILSLTAAIFFAVGYITSFEVWGIANYQRIVQRMPNLIFDLLAIVQLAKFFEYRRKRNLLLSILFFMVALVMGHFSIFLLPIFIFYPLCHFFLSKKSLKAFINTSLIIVLFFTINMFLVSRDPHAMESGRWVTLLNQGYIGEQILIQVSQIVIPLFIVELISKLANTGYPYTKVLLLLSLPLITIFVFGFYKLQKITKNKRLVLLYLTSLISLPLILLFNLQTTKVTPLTHTGTDRYYLVPSFFTAIILATLIWIVFNFNGRKYILASALIITFFVSYNTRLIWKTIDEAQYKSDAMKAYLNHIKSISQSQGFSGKTVLVMPTSLVWPGQMIETIYSNEPMTFIAFDETWEEKAKNHNKDDVFVIDYNYKARNLVDLTKKYRMGEKIEYYK